MANKNVLGSYLYEIKPYVDTNAWKQASGSIKKQMKEGAVSEADYTAQLKKQNDLYLERAQLARKIQEMEKIAAQGGDKGQRAKDMLSKFEDVGGELHETGLKADLAELDEQIKNTSVETEAMGNMVTKSGGGLGKFASGVTAAYGSAVAFVGAMKKGIETAFEIVETGTKMGNKLNAMGAFGSMETRDMMSRYGVSSTRANAMSSAMSLMGIDESDLGRLSSAQRKTYDELIKHYEQGINKIDTGKLEDYYKTIEEYQLKQAKWKMDIQNSILKLFAESETFGKLTGSLQKFFETTIKFLESDVVQWFFDVFLGFLSGLVDFASWFLDLFGGGSKGGNTNNTTNNNNNNNNTFYIYGSDSRNNDELARSIALQQNSGGVG